MRNATHLSTIQDDHHRYLSHRRPTYYEVCLSCQIDPLEGTHNAEMVDLCEAFETIFKRANTSVGTIGPETLVDGRLWRTVFEPMLGV